MEASDTIIYTLKQAVTNAIDLSLEYSKDYAVIETERGYSVVSARYAKHNIDKLTVEYVTDIKNN